MGDFLNVLFQVILTPTHLAIVMEYASGGELYELISNEGRFSENKVLDSLICIIYVSGLVIWVVHDAVCGCFS